MPTSPSDRRSGEKVSASPKAGAGLGVNEGRKDHVIAIVDTDDITPWLPPPAARARRLYFFTPISNTPLAPWDDFSAPTPRATCSATMRGSPKSATASKLPYWICATHTLQTATICSIGPNKFMDEYLKADPKNLPAKAKAEKYAKILAKTLINTDRGQLPTTDRTPTSYDAAEGLLASMPCWCGIPAHRGCGSQTIEERHIVSVFGLVQELLAPSGVKGKNQFQLLLTKASARP